MKLLFFISVPKVERMPQEALPYRTLMITSTEDFEKKSRFCKRAIKKKVRINVPLHNSCFLGWLSCSTFGQNSDRYWASSFRIKNSFEKEYEYSFNWCSHFWGYCWSKTSINICKILWKAFSKKISANVFWRQPHLFM